MSLSVGLIHTVIIQCVFVTGEHEPSKRKRKTSETVPEVPPRGIFSSSLFNPVKNTPGVLPQPRQPKEARLGLVGDRSEFSEAKLANPQLVRDRLVQNVLDKVSCLMATNERRCNDFIFFIFLEIFIGQTSAHYQYQDRSCLRLIICLGD